MNLLEMDLSPDDGPMHGPTRADTDTLAKMAEQFVDRFAALVRSSPNAKDLAGWVYGSNGRDVFVATRSLSGVREGVTFNMVALEHDLSSAPPGHLPCKRGPVFVPFPIDLRCLSYWTPKDLLTRRIHFVSETMAVVSTKWSPEPEPKDIRTSFVIEFGGVW